MTELELELWDLVKSKKCVETSLAAELWCDWIKPEYNSWIQFYDYVRSKAIKVSARQVTEILNTSVYGNDHEKFSLDWISKSDRESYFDFVKKASRRSKK